MVLRSVPPSADIGSLRMWHVTLTVSGGSQPLAHERQALERSGSNDDLEADRDCAITPPPAAALAGAGSSSRTC